MPLKLLPHKSWHVYNQENVARVKRDEARAAQEQEQNDERAFQAEAEARLDRLRNKSSRKRRRDGDNEGEKELERQLEGKGKGRAGEGEGGTGGGEGEHARAIIVRPEGWSAGKDGRTAKETKSDSTMTTNGHVNFWAELEAGTQAPASTLEKRLNKVLAEEPDDSLTKVYLAKRGEGEPKGWYASADGKTERERKEPVETTLERTYRDNESKKLDDPLALMDSYLRHRDDIKSGKPLPTPRAPSTRDRYLEPTSRHPPPPQHERDAWDDTPRSSVSSSARSSRASRSTDAQRSGFEPVLPRLLPPKHRRPPISALASTVPSAASSSSAQRPLSTAPPRPEDPQREATHRVQSERARAAALLASRRRTAAASSSSYAGSVASSPARSEGIGGWGMYNREEVLAARRGGGSAAAGGGGGGGWGERKERRQEREKFGTAGRGSYSRR